ncbi:MULTISPECIES: tyrosine-type recombinase/integrase [unclassified Nocardioides]|uniref:tyrosine-type recombinase/integrase n=1 Tax=unclassified Nocardioides TaxID=2615069 RepID=UPI000056F253|nr:MULTISPECIES: tyrosine-type recombinase/integrase [unclassified Nocardioides]ABL81476.1 phage integrase family protein [Nocardioides sp. JS614]
MATKMKDGITQRGRGWTYVVRERDPETGRSRQRWVSGFTTRAEAKAARDAARHALHSGTYVAPQDITVAEWLDRWMDGHEVTLKPSTAKTYRDKIRLYLKPKLGSARLQSLSPSGLTVVWRDLQASGGRSGAPLSRRTVEFARAVLHAAMQDAVVERIIQVNPVDGSKMAKRDGKPKHTTWTAAQVASFLTATTSDRWHPMWAVFASTGMRRGEVAGLRWSDSHGPIVDLDGGTIRVEVSTTQLDNRRVTTTPKNHERRTIAIDPDLVTVLRTWKATQAAERLAFGPGYADAEGIVFTWEDGRPVMPDYISKTFLTAQTKLKELAAGPGDDAPATIVPLPRLVLHGLRHTHATILLRSGVPVHVVARRLGHKDPSVTLDTYADVIPDDDSSAVDVFWNAVWGA